MTDKLKILLVQPYALGPGHYDAYTRRLCEGFCQAGADVTLITAAGTKTQWEKQLPIKSIEAVKSDSRFILKTENKYSPKFIGKITKGIHLLLTNWAVGKKAFICFGDGGYDALHFIDSELITLAILFFLFKEPENVFLTVPASYEMQNIFYKYTYNFVRKIMARWLFLRVKPITHTEYVKKSLIDSKIALGFEIPVIPWGIDASTNDYSKIESRKILGIDQSKKVFGFFGYLLAQKGFDFVLENWADLKEDFILLTRVHSDYDEEGKRIKNFIETKKIGSKILFNFGYTSEKDLALNICACDAILLPYKKFFQGESGIMSLACSHKIPLVSAHVGKIGEAVEKNGLGIVFEPESPAAFKRALEKFADFKEEDIKKIKENIGLYIKSLSWKEIACRHINFYKSCNNGI